MATFYTKSEGVRVRHIADVPTEALRRKLLSDGQNVEWLSENAIRMRCMMKYGLWYESTEVDEPPPKQDVSIMKNRKIRVRRGQAPMELYPLPDQETFNKQWLAVIVPRYGGGAIVTDWGTLDRDQVREKLNEIFTTSHDKNVLQRYDAWFRFMQFPIPEHIQPADPDPNHPATI